MDHLKNLVGQGSSDSSKATQEQPQQQSSGGFMGKINNMAGGGAQGEKNEDLLDKGVDMFQEKVMGQGPQNNENAAEQAKDEAISDAIRDQYRKATGKEFPIADKDKNYGKW
jgi:hypothetical protein